MAEPLTELGTGSGVQRTRAQTERSSSSPGSSHDSIRRAITCLRTSERQLRREDAQQTDEILSLLRAATMHLQQALEPRAASPAE